MSETRTLGVEEELHIVSAETCRLVSGAPQLLSRLPDDHFAAELQRSTVETNTAVCSTLSELRQDVVQLRKAVATEAERCELRVAAAGSAPLASVTDFELTAKGRFSRMQQDYRLLVDEQLICSLQVHVGVPDRDSAIRLMQRVDSALPTLLALSASSPYWSEQDTGYASVRHTIWQRWPTAGRTPHLDSGADYDRLLEALIASGVISDAKMAYFDVRPSSHAPTLELRVCDATPLVDDVILLAGLWRAVVEHAAEQDRAGGPPPVRHGPLYRAAMWRAARSGLTGPLLDEGPEPAPRPAAEVVRSLLGRLRPCLEEAGDWDEVSFLAEATLRRGSSSDRQRAAFAQRGRMTDVVELLIAETSGSIETTASATRSDATKRWTSDYQGSSVDEAVDGGGAAIPAYRPVLDVLDRLGPDELVSRADSAHQLSAERGLTFGVDGEQRVFGVDLVPRIILAHEWAALAAGLTQRARAIEAFLRDAYGPAEIVNDGVIPAAILFGCPAWRDEARLLPKDVPRAPVIGFDLVRDSIGGWRVLEDNARVPSGVGYAVETRRLMQEVMPELSTGEPIRSPENVMSLLRTTLQACSPRHDAHHDVVVALLSEGVDNSGWFEHQLLADEADLLLAQPGDVHIEGRRVSVRGRGVDVVYLRLGCELADLTDTSGRAVGPELLRAAARGDVVLANAPGNGVADDKAMYCYVPDLITYYLGERPLLAPVPTYRCADASEREAVCDRLGELVTKPVGGSGGGGVLIGPDAAADELDIRRREIEDDPAAWVAQETVSLSTLPTFVDGRLVARHVDLRAFVYLTGTGPGDATLADLALTRTAPGGSMVVNSSRGGGAKDTWIMLDVPEPGHGDGAGGQDAADSGDGRRYAAAGSDDGRRDAAADSADSRRYAAADSADGRQYAAAAAAADADSADGRRPTADGRRYAAAAAASRGNGA